MTLIAETQDARPDGPGPQPSHREKRRRHHHHRRPPGTERIRTKAYNQVPLVLADRSLVGAGLHTVAPDDILGRPRGRGPAGTRPYEAGPVDRPALHLLLQRRTEGFQKAVSLAGAELIDIGEDAREPSVNEGRRLTMMLMARDEIPTAILAHNDLMALGVLDALAEQGFACPEAISLVGYDDLPLTAYTSPPLTTIRLPATTSDGWRPRWRWRSRRIRSPTPPI